MRVNYSNPGSIRCARVWFGKSLRSEEAFDLVTREWAAGISRRHCLALFNSLGEGLVASHKKILASRDHTRQQRLDIFTLVAIDLAIPLLQPALLAENQQVVGFRTLERLQQVKVSGAQSRVCCLQLGITADGLLDHTGGAGAINGERWSW